MPCPLTGRKMFYAVPIFLCRTKNLFTNCAKQKVDLHSVKLVFVPVKKFFEEALNAVKHLGWLKKFGPAQNILGPVKGQVISYLPSFSGRFHCCLLQISVVV